MHHIAIEGTGHLVNGVVCGPLPAARGGSVTIVYNGLLANSGASQVYLHAGYGQDWHDSLDMPMIRTARGWENTILIQDVHELNFCFRDAANNWDNNNGHNWRLEVIS